MGNTNACCNGEKETQHQIEGGMVGSKPEPLLDRANLKGSAPQEFTKGTIPSSVEPIPAMFQLSKEAQETFQTIGQFNPTAPKNDSQAKGPFKIVNDSFDFGAFCPAVSITNEDAGRSESTFFGCVNSSNKREGFGTIISKNGHEFSGFFKDDKPHGEGRIIFKNGDYLIGNFNGNSIEGQGQLTFVTKESYYKGDFLKNLPHGQGELTSTKHFTVGYIGQWKNGLKHGFGTERWEDDTIYEGSFFEGQKHGNGKFSWPDGATYEGEFSLNVINGKGTHSWDDGRVFVGGWKDNKMHGKINQPLKF